MPSRSSTAASRASPCIDFTGWRQTPATTARRDMARSCHARRLHPTRPPGAGPGLIVLRILAGLAGGLVVGATLMSAVRTFVLPRGDATVLTRGVFLAVRTLFNARMRFSQTYEERDRIFALFAPVSLLIIPFVWLVLVGSGYTGIFWGVSHPTWWHAAEASG